MAQIALSSFTYPDVTQAGRNLSVCQVQYAISKVRYTLSPHIYTLFLCTWMLMPVNEDSNINGYSSVPI